MQARSFAERTRRQRITLNPCAETVQQEFMPMSIKPQGNHFSQSDSGADDFGSIQPNAQFANFISQIQSFSAAGPASAQAPSIPTFGPFSVVTATAVAPAPAPKPVVTTTATISTTSTTTTTSLPSWIRTLS